MDFEISDIQCTYIYFVAVHVGIHLITLQKHVLIRMFNGKKRGWDLRGIYVTTCTVHVYCISEFTKFVSPVRHDQQNMGRFHMQFPPQTLLSYLIVIKKMSITISQSCPQ
jgi:hypothetical protein